MRVRLNRRAAAVLILAFSAAFFLCLRKPLFNAPLSPVLYDRAGVLLGAHVASDFQYRLRAPRGALNPKFAAALIEYEDRRFYLHAGVDPLAVARAALQNLRGGRVLSGASTLTMQTIRLSRKSRPRSFAEKVVEAALALRLEAGCSKAEILALYAANAPFGGNAVGLEAAAWRWFGHKSAELSWAEAAALAVLPNAPALVHPGRNRGLLRSKRDALLTRLFRGGRFDAETLRLALAEPLPETPRPLPQYAYHYLMRTADDERAKTALSPLDARVQTRAGAILQRRSEALQQQGIMNAACIILDTQSGEPFAYVGNIDTPLAPFVDMARARRSSGSLLKPFLFGAMLDSGELLPGELVSDIPTRIESYQPENNTRAYSGAVPANEALTRSLNVPAVRELRRYGVARFAAVLRSFGITTLFRKPEEYGLPLILGGAEITLEEICQAYALLGRIAAGSTKARPLSRGAAYLTLETLTGVARPEEEASWRYFAGARSIAWKTGTSFGFRDAWAVGVTPRWTIGVWVGNATGEGRAELRAAETAAPALFELFSFLDAAPWFDTPWSDIAIIDVCAASGFPAGVNCAAISEAEIPKNAPRRAPCPYCRTLTLNAAGDRQVRLEAADGESVRREKWFVLPPAEEWYYRRRHLEYRPPPPFEDGPDGAALPLALFNPEPLAQIYVPVELDGSPGRVVFRAAHRAEDAVIYWHLDNTYLGSTTRFHEWEARPAAGAHILTIVDAAGNSVRRGFTVLE